MTGVFKSDKLGIMNFSFTVYICLYLFIFNFLGVAGFVLNEKKELLVIRERFSVIQSKPWKLPGGLADKGKPSPGCVTFKVSHHLDMLHYMGNWKIKVSHHLAVLQFR